MWNAAWNSLTTLTMLDTRAWLNSSPDAEPLSRSIMREMITIGRACGVPLADDLVDRFMERINALPAIGTSMQTDCKSGRPMEIDVILGFPVRKARELRISVPYVEAVYVILKAVDCRLRATLEDWEE